MDANLRVFVVDDDQVILDVLAETLGGGCDLETFVSGKACLDRLAAVKPDLFLLDVSMPVMDGYALCRHLKDDWETQDIPVLFASARDDSETRLLCYEAGGDDFIQKPFSPVELAGKLKVAGRILDEKKALREQAGYAQKTAMAAMVSMGELGVVLQFMSKSFACDSIEDLAGAMIDAMGQYDLQAAIQMRLGNDVLSLSQNGRNVPLEVSVLNHVRDSGRIFQFKTRCVFNYGRVTLMVNNMPVDDAERCGRIRDNGALLAEGADARLKAIEAEMLAARRRAGIELALPRLYSTLDGVQNNYRRNCFELTQVMIDFQEALTKAFIHLGLMEKQEELLSNMANEFMLRVVGTQDASLEIVGQLEMLAEDLKVLLKH
ncbi:MAG: response regulator [Gammaproteobacteria bacterium]|nr:response regulator [Gammaproteobacteria bacterium]MBU1601394.1 response regulator [Gammaproteobacteria bacterium]MBU2433589.1 response regulator [Gammaproteobacteria bacterium]MBU2449874.1 response regulator [Gammaproteobacteria bacterium]